MDEFALIERYFAPLSEGYDGAFGLSDDAAVVEPAAGEAIVATVDAIVAGVHFIGDEAAEDIAAKALRVNLSDLAAMGATPLGYLIALAIPTNTAESWVAGFSRGLAADQTKYGVTLLGGDTVATEGPLTVSITALGGVAKNKALRRSGARPGDRIFVSGTLGDAALGLRLVQSGIPDDAPSRRLVDRYLRPDPRVGLGPGLVGLASAAIDVSDGLVADLDHVCRCSAVAAVVEADRLPLSRPAQDALAADPSLLAEVVTGGDDYELLFTVPSDRLGALPPLADALDLALTEIGRIEEGQGVTVLSGDGAPLDLARTGYRHF